jgi:UDP-3-O-[3-hydroxymyristoyl] N-acetylglucosamine deacetylase
MLCEREIFLYMTLAETITESVTCRCQNTLRQPIAYSGIGIHTGKIVSIRFCPAEQGTGILFKRVDLPSQPVIPATLEYVCDTSRSTTIGVADIRIHTVEHILAAIRAFEIDNVIIEISSIEPPVANGSSDVFVKMIEDAGVEMQAAEARIVKLKQPVFWSEGDIHIVAHPYEGYRISYTLNYPESKTLKCQYYSVMVDKNSFKHEIAPCRTFSQYKEVSDLMDRGLIKGGSLDNAVIIKDDAVFSKGGLHFPDEMVRHKILDMIGDLTLVGYHFHAHIISVRSGHQSNAEFSKKLYKTLTMENA